MYFARFAIEKRVISALSTILILIAGYFAYVTLPRFEDPDFIIRVAQIITPYPGATAEEVAEEVTEKLEEALQQLSGVKEIKSVSSPGVSTVSIEFTIPAAKTRPVLIQKFTQMRAKISDGKARMSAVIEAGLSRARPVALGVMTTVLGVVPLLWDPFFKSLAVVIICGLSFATLLTLIVVPTLYAVFFRVKNDELDTAATIPNS